MALQQLTEEGLVLPEEVKHGRGRPAREYKWNFRPGIEKAIDGTENHPIIEGEHSSERNECEAPSSPDVGLLENLPIDTA
jgi:hypothetical protein